MLPLKVKASDLLDTCQALLVHVQIALMHHNVFEMRLGFAGMWAYAPLWILLLGPVDRAGVAVDDDFAPLLAAYLHLACVVAWHVRVG